MSKFKITGPGEYWTRDGRKAQVTARNDHTIYCWKGRLEGRDEIWREDGFNIDTRKDDIIGPLVVDAIKPSHDAGEPVKTLRDEMAMAALPIISTSLQDHIDQMEGEFNGNDDEALACVAKWSYKLADVMMAARQKGGVK